ncbi:hypothetical protein CRYUN_Cryun16bG0071600 [Craigia yunnanensis]
MKFRRPQLKKSSGGTDLKKKLKKSSRRKVNSQDHQHSIIPSSEVDSSPHYLKPTSSSNIKEQLQASPRHSESSFDSCEQDKKMLPNEKQNLAYPDNKSIRVLRTSTLGPKRILTKMANHVEIKPGGSESDGTAVLNVCRYSYCSLHGHHHGNKPTLKRFVLMRRRTAKTQKSLKQDRQCSGKKSILVIERKESKQRRVFTGYLGGVAVQRTTVDIREISSVSGKEGNDFVTLAESAPDESSYPIATHEENLHQSNNPLKVEQPIPGTFQVFKDRSVDCSGNGAEQQKATSDTPGTKIKVEELVRINPHNGDHSHSKYGDVSSQEFGDPTQFDKLLEPDKTISTRTERVPADEEAHRDVDEDIASSLNSEEYKGQSKNYAKNLETVSTGGSCELPNGLCSSASVTGMMEELTTASEENNEDSELDHGILQPEDSMAASSTDVACKKEMEIRRISHFGN